jgi:tetratricopeptide (TPR) repeat protein
MNKLLERKKSLLFYIPGPVTLAILLIISENSLAQDESIAAVFLKNGGGVRPAGMGEAFGAVVGDPNAVFWNPAGLTGIPNTSLEASHTEFLVDSRFENLTFATKWNADHAFGMNAYFGYSGEIEKINASGEMLSPYRVYDLYATAAYGFRLDYRHAVGLGVKMIYQKIDSFAAWDWAVDAGFMMLDFLPGLSLAGILRNFGPPMRFFQEAHQLPLECILAASCGLFSNRMLLTMDVSLPLMEEMIWKWGGEYNIDEAFFFRAGYRYAQYGNDLGPWSGLSLGFGIKVAEYNADYAFTPFEPLGQIHRLGLTFPFGSNWLEEEKMLKKLEDKFHAKQSSVLWDLMEKAAQHYKEKRYDLSLLFYEKAQALDPQNPKIEALVKTAELDQRQEYLRTHYEAGLRSFAQKQYIDALLEWNKVAERQNDYLDIQSRVSLAKTRLNESILEFGQTQVNQRRHSERLFEEGVALLAMRRFGAAIQIWKKILVEDSDNAAVKKYLESTLKKLNAEIRSEDARAEFLWSQGDWFQAVYIWHCLKEMAPDAALPKAKLAERDDQIRREIQDWYLRGVNFYVRNQWGDAIKIWQKILMIDSDNRKVQENLKRAQHKIELVGGEPEQPSGVKP